MKFLSLLLVMFVVTLTGCAGNPTIQTVTVYQDKLVDIPDNLLKPCSTTQPPEKQAYIASNSSKKEQSLANYSINLIKDIKNCNEQITEIKLLQEKQRKILEGKKTQ